MFTNEVRKQEVSWCEV